MTDAKRSALILDLLELIKSWRAIAGSEFYKISYPEIGHGFKMAADELEALLYDPRAKDER